MRPLACALVLLSTAACGGQPPAAPAAGTSDGELQFFTLNRLGGYAEAVPCQPGSVSTLAAASVLRDEAAAGGGTALLLVTGNTLLPETQATGYLPVSVGIRARGRVILEALAAARPDAWLPGKDDLEHGPKDVLGRAHALGIPTLISNLAEGTHPEVLRSLVRQAGGLRVGFIGLLSPHEPGTGKTDAAEGEEVDPESEPDPGIELVSTFDTARQLSERLRRDEGVHLVVALSTLKPSINAKLAESGAVDLIVGGADVNLSAGRIVIVGKSAMLSARPEGREVGQTRLCIRGGNLQMADLSPLRTLPAENESLQRQFDALVERAGTTDLPTLARLASPGNEDEFMQRMERLEENRAFLASHQDFQGSFIDHTSAALGPVPADHPVLVALAGQGPAIEEDYSRFKRPIDAPPEDATPRIPVPEDCRGCHANQVRFWEQTAHAQAYSAIAESHRGRDPLCLSCHTAAYLDKDGWYDPRLNAPRGPVTCYSCHKATAVHSSSRIYVLDSSQLVTDGRYMDCASCHDDLHSPGFDKVAELPGMSCPPMRDDEPAIVLARERAVEALAARGARGEAEPLDDYLLARGLVGLGREDEGFPKLFDSARANKENPRQTIETARLFDAHGRSRDAIEVVRDYLAVNTGDPDLNQEHVRLMLEARDPAARDPAQALAQLELLLAGLDSKDTHQLDFQLLQVDALLMLDQAQKAMALLQSLSLRHGQDERVIASVRKLNPPR